MAMHLDDSIPITPPVTSEGYVVFVEVPRSEVSAEDTEHCSGSGGSWSDLMSRIDELTEES